MYRSRKKRLAMVRDLGRLIAPMDVLYQVGKLIHRRSLRYTVLMAAVALLGVMVQQLNFKHIPGLNVRQAIALPLVVGGAALIGGYVMKLIPRVISSRLLTVAQASGLNLMEDYRKAQTGEHLAVLWQRLFQHECRLRIAAGLPAMKGLDPPGAQSQSEALACARGLFLTRVRESLETPQPQIRQMFNSGLDLRYLEDWRDGAYLDRSDTKLMEQFEGNITLLAARRQAGLCTLWASGRLKVGRVAQRFWFFFLTRMVAIEAGGAVEYLNRRYETDVFNAQAILWPGEEDAAWMQRFDGSRAAVLQRRRRLVRRIFGPDYASAVEMLRHMLYAQVAQATELRMRFDPEYCVGSLGYDALGDLARLEPTRWDLRRARRFVDRARRNLEAIDAYLRANRPELLTPANAWALRAARIALHVRSARRRVWTNAGQGVPAARRTESIAAAVEHTVKKQEDYSRHLVAVRLHHELSFLARNGYRDLVRDLIGDS